ncbi:Mur ligase domain-containing protein [Chromatium okenii]|uniref:Mur ligase domain-containing protein n=1 Tax=Chromatium okenii TaxID=61644 RepID=UPI001F5B6E92|nr:Mur ligase domain-containing protein [Chromatium okenii]
MWILSAAVATVGGQLLGADQAFTEVSSDSRVDCSGHLFIALRGEHFDGHDHVAAAQAAGAVAAMVDHPLPVDIPQWVVADTRLGLGQLAQRGGNVSLGASLRSPAATAKPRSRKCSRQSWRKSAGCWRLAAISTTTSECR